MVTLDVDVVSYRGCFPSNGAGATAEYNSLTSQYPSWTITLNDAGNGNYYVDACSPDYVGTTADPATWGAPTF